MNASCAERTPEVRVVGSFPATLSRVTPATAGPGDQAGRTGLRLAAVGAAAVGDAVWRWYYGDGVKGWGLRGGTFRFTGNGSRIGIRLTRVRWTSDTRVSGTVRWNQVSGQVRARLTISRAGRDLRLRRAPVLRLRPALGGPPVWPLPGPADHRHDACPVIARRFRDHAQGQSPSAKSTSQAADRAPRPSTRTRGHRSWDAPWDPAGLTTSAVACTARRRPVRRPRRAGGRPRIRPRRTAAPAWVARVVE